MAPAIPPGVSSLLGIDSGESWQDRLREAAYTSPKGTRIKFEYVDVGMGFTLRGTAWEFPRVNDAYVQQKGFGPRRYPLRVFFSGRDHDLVATAFVAALCEDGIGQLEHPLYGTFKCVPFGDIDRRDDLTTAANQTVLEVTFWTTLRQVYPNSQGHPRSEIDAALGNFDVKAAQQFEERTSLASAVNRADLKATIRSLLRDISATIRIASDATASVKREFDDTMRLVNFGMDVLVGQPLLLARQLTNLITAPARAVAGIQSRLAAYAALADRIFGSAAGLPGSSPTVIAVRREKLVNDFQVAHLMASSAVAGSVRSTIEHQFATKPEALAAAERVLEQFDALVAWHDAGLSDLSEIDTGESYQALLRAVALTAGFLIEVSFQLVPERRIVLDRPRTIIDLAAELYGSVDDRLDLLINSNDLTGSEILELPRGRVVKYYATS